MVPHVMLGVNAMRDITRPEEGWWLVRVTKGGAFVPARIVYERPADPWFPDNDMSERSGEWRAYIGDRECAHWDEVWLRRGTPISQAEFEHQMDRRRFWADHEPEHPLAVPEKPVDWMQSRLPF